MKVRIGGIEIIDPTWEELDALVTKYGGLVNGAGHSGEEKAENGGSAMPHQRGSIAAKDRVALDKLVAAGAAGVPTQEIGEVLGKLGKAVRPELVRWAGRVGLTHDDTFDPFEECRSGSRRAVRLKGSVLSVAKEIQQGSW